MRKILVFLLILFFTNAQCKTPGYLGKRFSFGYNASTFPFYDVRTDLPSGIRLSYKSEFRFSYAAGRKINIGFSFYNAIQKYYGEEFQGYIPHGTIPFKLQIYEIHLQLFPQSYISPIGFYDEFAVGLVQYNLANEITTLYYRPNPYIPKPPTYDLKKSIDNYWGFKMSYHIGKTNAIGHHLFLNSAIGINFFRGGDTVYISSPNNIDSYASIVSSINLRRHNFFDIKLGLGWVAF